MTSPDLLPRGAVITIAGGDSEFGGKPRPALLLHPSDLFGTEVPLPICLITSRAVEAPLLRIPLPADQTTGLQVPSWAAIDLMMTIRRRRIGQHIGQIDRDTMIFIDRALLVFLGLA